MVNKQLLQLLESILGRGIKLKKNGEYKFSCPAHTEGHGPKLQIQLDDAESHFGSYNCWVCGFKGERLTSLFKKVNASYEKFQELNRLLGIRQIKKLNKYDLFFNKEQDVETKIDINLPNEFIPLWTNEYSWSPDYKQAKFYLLNKRHLTENDILRYRIGYAESGLYNGMIIIPSYDKNGLLNFYVGRSFYDNITYKHKKPNISNNLIGFELFINWKLPVILCEGAIDAITIKNNAIPLFGKQIMPKLYEKIIEMQPPKVIICLDKDAYKSSFNIMKKFIANGIDVYFTNITDNIGKDANELGYEKITNFIINSERMNTNKLLKYKILNRI